MITVEPTPLRVDVAPGLTMAWRAEWFGPAWHEPETIVFIHGAAESGEAWRQWVPVLSGRYRLVRPDLPGFGGSTAPDGYDWSWHTVVPDLVRFMDLVGIDRAHVVGAKYGGCIAMALAFSAPERVRTLGLFGAPGAIPAHHRRATGTPLDLIADLGVAGWARKTMPSRLGRSAPQAQLDWWADGLMGRSDPRAVVGCSSALARLDFGDGLSRIQAPTLVVTTSESGLQDVQAARAYQQSIPVSELQEMASDCFHVAAVEPEACARRMLAFMEAHPT